MGIWLKFGGEGAASIREAKADDPAEMLWVLYLLGACPTLTKEEFQGRLKDFAGFIYSEIPVRDDQPDGTREA